MLNYVYLVFEIIALLTALFQFQKLKQTNYKYFVIYLFFVVIYEIGSLYNWFSINHRNLWIANLTMSFSFIFYSLLLLKIIKKDSLQKKIKLSINLAISFSFINILFIQGFWNLNTITILLEYAILISTTCLYFYELLNCSEKLIVVKLPDFWLNTGLLFFCLAQFLFFTAFSYMAYKGSRDFNGLFYVISNVANAILYSCLTISFLCFSKIANSLQQS